MREVVALGVGLAAGVAVGRWWPVPDEIVHVEAPQEVVDAPVPTSRTAIVCARAPEGTSSDELRLKWCEAQVGALKHRLNRTRLPWPEGLPPEAGPDGFADAVEDVAANCGAGVLATDCTEYPCVALLDTTQPRAVTKRCNAFDDVGGDGEGLQVDTRWVRCADGHLEGVPIVYDLGPDGTFEDHVDDQFDTGAAEDQFLGDLGPSYEIWHRRAEDVVALVADELCAEAPSE